MNTLKFSIAPFKPHWTTEEPDVIQWFRMKAVDLEWLNRQPVGMYVDMIDCKNSFLGLTGLTFRFRKTIAGWRRTNYPRKIFTAEDLASWEQHLREVDPTELLELLTREEEDNEIRKP